MFRTINKKYHQRRCKREWLLQQRRTISKIPKSQVGSLTQKAAEIEVTQGTNQVATMEATEEVIQEDIHEMTEEGCTEDWMTQRARGQLQLRSHKNRR